MWRAPLQRKFLIALLVVGLLPGIAALGATYWSSRRSLERSIGSGFQEIARATALRLATSIDNEIEHATRLALSMVQRRTAADGSTTLRLRTTDADLTAWAAQSEDYLAVMVADADGRLVAASHPPLEPVTDADVRQALWWQEPMRDGGAAYISTLHLVHDGQEYGFDVATAIMAPDRQTPLGVVRLIVRRARLTKSILSIRVGDTGHGMLVDTAGTPLICPFLPPTSHLMPRALIEQFSTDRPTWFVAEDDAHGDRHTLVGAAPVQISHRLTALSLGGQRWYAFVRQQAAETYAPIYSLLVTVGGLGLILVVALAGIGSLVGAQLVAPLVALREEADALRRRLAAPAHQGGSHARPPGVPAPTTREIPSSTDEIHDLTLAFHTMRHALDENVSTIRAQQAQLVRRARLASVGQLLAALAHDLRNPLGVIRSAAQVMLDRTRDTAVKEEVAHYVIDEVDRLTTRITDFLRYARQKPPEPARVAADAPLRAALKQWEALGGHDRIQVTLRITPGLPIIAVDAEQVMEAYVNLLINAREAMPNGGNLTLAVALAPSGAVAVTIQDSGCGMSPAQLRRIFEPFFTTKEYGTGLGLTNVQRLIEDNGGALQVDSQEGVGTTFTLYFPALPAQDFASSSPAPSARPITPEPSDRDAMTAVIREAVGEPDLPATDGAAPQAPQATPISASTRPS